MPVSALGSHAANGPHSPRFLAPNCLRTSFSSNVQRGRHRPLILPFLSRASRSEVPAAAPNATHPLYRWRGWLCVVCTYRPDNRDAGTHVARTLGALGPQRHPGRQSGHGAVPWLTPRHRTLWPTGHPPRLSPHHDSRRRPDGLRRSGVDQGKLLVGCGVSVLLWRRYRCYCPDNEPSDRPCSRTAAGGGPQHAELLLECRRGDVSVYSRGISGPWWD